MADSLVETPASSSSHLINLGMNQLPVDLQAGSSSGGSSSSTSTTSVVASSSSSAPAPSSSGAQTSTLLISVATQPTHGLNLSEQIMTPGGQPQEQLNLTLQSQQAEAKDAATGKSGRSADRSGEDEPEVKRKKIDKPSTKMIEKLEARLGGILCCAVCLDLPRTAMYQVNLSIHHLFLPIPHPLSPFPQTAVRTPISSFSLCVDNPSNPRGPNLGRRNTFPVPIPHPIRREASLNWPIQHANSRASLAISSWCWCVHVAKRFTCLLYLSVSVVVVGLWAALEPRVAKNLLLTCVLDIRTVLLWSLFLLN